MNQTHIGEYLERNVQILKINNWHVQTLPTRISLGGEYEIPELERIAMEWVKHFNPKHKNLMTEHFGVPSNVIRFDYVIDKLGDIRVYEIEDRPAGFGITEMISKHAFDLFIKSLQSYSKYFNKPLGLCISEGRFENSDDISWAAHQYGKLRIACVPKQIPRNIEEYIWLVRSLRTEEEYYELSPFSLSTIEFEGDKSYGLGLGLWKHVDVSTTHEINWENPSVFKPEAGCRCENVHMWHPNKPTGGFSTRSKIMRAIESGEVQYMQDYYAPEKPYFLPEEYFMIRRCELVFDIESGKYKVIGGVWEARPKCQKIHGANDSICGPLVL